MNKIEVEYPSTVKEVIFTEAEMRAKGYKGFKGDKTRNVFVNRPQVIVVKEVKRLVQEEFMNDQDTKDEETAACLRKTGMNPAAYQVKFNRAWND